jgi:adenosylmethionine-8-amino-7-oxononanoate aminotransferase
MTNNPAPGSRSSWGAAGTGGGTGAAQQPTGSEGAITDTPDLSARAARHLWMHFSRMGSYKDHEVPVIVRGEGAWVWDQHGKKYLDGLGGLFTTMIGYGRSELGEAGAKQSETLAYFPLWTYAHPRAVELAERIAAMTPGDLNRVFFTTGGSEAVESAWKLARQYFRLTGQPQRTKVISRYIAYHGTSMGALSITGIPELRTPFEPLVPGAIKVPNTNFYRAPLFADDEVAFGQWAADEIERAILREGPDTVAAVYLEPVQNAGGCFPPPPGYFQRVREICDRHGVLLVSDEVICAFGRLGHWFGALRYDYQPDIITVAKGLTSGYAPLGAMIASDRLMEPFLGPGASFLHGFTFAGHPVSCAVAMANLDILEGERILQHVQATEDAFRSALEGLYDLPIVGDVRGAGFFYGIELVKDKTTRLSFDDDESERLLRGFLSGALFDAGLICRADDRGDPVVQLSPPLICGQEEIDFIASTLREVLGEAWRRM